MLFKKRRWGFITFFIVLIFFLLICIFYGSSKTSGTVYLPGLHGSVIIKRDQYGVVYINAQKSDLDAFYALGYVHAQGRFWQMIFQKHVVSGTLSELFGKKTIKQDKFLRTWGFYRAAKLAWCSLDQATKAMVISYTAGINAFIKQGHFPFVFTLLHYKPRYWTVYDSIAWQKMMAWDLQNEWEAKLKNEFVKNHYSEKAVDYYFPPYPATAPTTLSLDDLRHYGLLPGPRTPVSSFTIKSHDDPTIPLSVIKTADTIKTSLGLQAFPGKGSNSWVVSGKYTLSKKPLLANDVHLSLTAPSLWYLAHLKGPHLDVTGATIPGLPAIVIGHNRHIAWGITAGYGDTQDLYRLSSHSKIQILHENISVKNSATIAYQVKLSHYGPIINTVTPHMPSGRLKIAIRWPALQANDTTVEAFYRLQYAKDWHDFTDALSYFVTPTLNFLFADTKGNIGYYYAGKVPIRKDWTGQFVASTKQTWQGYIPFANLPHTYNPKEGFIVSANNKVAPQEYPYVLNARWPVPPYRIERIRDLLQSQHTLTMNSMKQIQSDTLSEFWLRLKPTLLRTQPLDEKSRLAITLLHDWNGFYTRNSIGATIFSYWLQQFTSLWPNTLAYGHKWLEPLFLEKTLHNKPLFLSKSLQAAMKCLNKQKGNRQTNWQWGKIHHAIFNELGVGRSHLIAWIWKRTISTPGGQHTIDLGTFGLKNFNQVAGPTYRQIINLNHLDDSLYIETLGQSGNILSKHYSDLLTKWRNGNYIKITKNNQFESSLTLLPKKIIKKINPKKRD